MGWSYGTLSTKRYHTPLSSSKNSHGPNVSIYPSYIHQRQRQ